MRILEQGAAVIVNAVVPAEKIKADDTRFANRGGRMSGVHAAKGKRTYSDWKANTVSYVTTYENGAYVTRKLGLHTGRASRLATETLHNGTNTPVKGRGGNYRPK